MSGIFGNNVSKRKLASFAGASIVGFITNAFGATFRTVEQKLSDFVSVLDFGAKGNGVDDDKNAIQNAINYVEANGGGVVFFPKGIYTISSTIVVGNGVTLLGSNRSEVFVKCNAAMIADAALNGTNMVASKNYNINQSGQPIYASAESIKIENISFYYSDNLPGPNEKINCIGFNNARRLIVRNCAMYRICQHAVDISGCEDVLIENVICEDGYWSALQVDTAGGLYGSSGGGYISRNVTIRDCKVLNP